MRLRTLLVAAVLAAVGGMLAMPVFPALAGHTTTIAAQAQVREWIDLIKEMGGSFGFYAILNSRAWSEFPTGVLDPVEIDADKGIVRARCAKPGSARWFVEYTVSSRETPQDRHYLQVSILCVEKDTEK